MVKAVTAVKRDSRGRVLLASLSDGTTIDSKRALYLTKVGQLNGMFVGKDPFSAKECVVAFKEIPDIEEDAVN